MAFRKAGFGERERESDNSLPGMLGRGQFIGVTVWCTVRVGTHEVVRVLPAVLPDLVIQGAASFQGETSRRNRGRFFHHGW